MKELSIETQETLSKQLRRLLNEHPQTAGSDAVLLFFKGAPDGINLGVIMTGKPPSIQETIQYLVNYVAAAAYRIGRADALLEKGDPNHIADLGTH